MRAMERPWGRRRIDGRFSFANTDVLSPMAVTSAASRPCDRIRAPSSLSAITTNPGRLGALTRCSVAASDTWTEVAVPSRHVLLVPAVVTLRCGVNRLRAPGDAVGGAGPRMNALAALKGTVELPAGRRRGLSQLFLFRLPLAACEKESHRDGGEAEDERGDDDGGVDGHGHGLCPSAADSPRLPRRADRPTALFYESALS